MILPARGKAPGPQAHNQLQEWVCGKILWVGKILTSSIIKPSEPRNFARLVKPDSTSLLLVLDQ